MPPRFRNFIVCAAFARMKPLVLVGSSCCPRCRRALSFKALVTERRPARSAAQGTGGRAEGHSHPAIAGVAAVIVGLVLACGAQARLEPQASSSLTSTAALAITAGSLFSGIGDVEAAPDRFTVNDAVRQRAFTFSRSNLVGC